MTPLDLPPDPIVTKTLLAIAAAAALTSPLAAQSEADRTIVQVTDVRGNAIPFATVQIGRGATRVADDSGRVVFNVKPADSINVIARRIGFQPFTGWVKRKEGQDFYLADLPVLPRTLDPVTIAGRRDTPLARTGFYDRAERIQRGAYTARFITPEELDLRNPIRLSNVFAGDSYVKVTPNNGKQVLMGRGIMCAMTIIVDGQRLLGTYEEAVGNPNPPRMSSLAAIDDVVNVQSIAGIEVYASNNSVPVELQRAAGARMSQGCGLIAIWTGARK